MITVSVLPSKSQSISVSLAGQQCNIKIVQRQSFMYMDLTVNEVPIMQGVPCLHGNKMVRY
ncbi:hypothetical protein EP764_25315, partial [Escherichia coli]|nr:hypothetical protein [Escherichia coli]